MLPISQKILSRASCWQQSADFSTSLTCLVRFLTTPPACCFPYLKQGLHFKEAQEHSGKEMGGESADSPQLFRSNHRTHSDNCIQLTQLPRWEERRRTARWKSRRKCIVEHCFQVVAKSICTGDAVTSSAAGKRLMGGNMQPP